MGETDKAFKKFMLAATSGRYQPPSRKTALEELTSCVSLSRQLVKAEIHEVMEEDGLDVCLSGEPPPSPLGFLYILKRFLTYILL
jgi:hypothetical protein